MSCFHIIYVSATGTNPRKPVEASGALSTSRPAELNYPPSLCSLLQQTPKVREPVEFAVILMLRDRSSNVMCYLRWPFLFSRIGRATLPRLLLFGDSYQSLKQL